MGTSWTVKVNAFERYSHALAEALQAEFDLVDGWMSNWKDDSDVSRFNEASPGECVTVSPSTQKVVLTALKLHELSDGAFDVSASPLIQIWGFGTTFRAAEQPTEEQINAAMAQLGTTGLRIIEDTLCQGDRPIQLNLSALAKGYAVDRAAELLSLRGFENYLVEVGGELRASGQNGRGTIWTIAIEKPSDVPGIASVQSALPLANQAVATSGDYRNFYVEADQRFSHIIDPRNGYPVKHDLASVTVLSESSMIADAWATALLVLGPKRGMEIAEARQLQVYMILRTEQGFQILTSSTWPVG